MLSLLPIIIISNQIARSPPSLPHSITHSSQNSSSCADTCLLCPGIIPRLNLRTAIDVYVDDHPEVQSLSDIVRNLDAMVVEEEEWIEVSLWPWLPLAPSELSCPCCCPLASSLCLALFLTLTTSLSSVPLALSHVGFSLLAILCHTIAWVDHLLLVLIVEGWFKGPSTEGRARSFSCGGIDLEFMRSVFREADVDGTGIE